MASLAPKFLNHLRRPAVSAAMGLQGISSVSFSTSSLGLGGSNNDNGEAAGDDLEIDDDYILHEKSEFELQGVDPKKGWNFRGVHKAIICGKIGQAPVQKILRNGRTVTTFTVGTGGMFDQRFVGDIDSPKPAQWHRIAVHNPWLETYVVQQLVQNSSVYVEGDIETRVYNDSIGGEVKSITEICVRRDGKVERIKPGGNAKDVSVDELWNGL